MIYTFLGVGGRKLSFWGEKRVFAIVSLIIFKIHIKVDRSLEFGILLLDGIQICIE